MVKDIENEVSEINEEETERYSFSKLNAFHTCPYGYKLRYIDHLKGEGNCFSSYGSEVHSIMERYAKNEISLDLMADIFKWEFDVSVPEPFPYTPFCKNMRELYYNQGINFLKNFPGYDDREILEVETSFEHKIDDWVFNGITDLVFKTKDGKIILQDYKSKSGFKSKKEQHEYARQLYLYSIFIKEKYGKYPDILRFLMFRKNITIDINFDKNDFNEALTWAKETVKEIRNCKEFIPNCDKFFSENLCNHRKYCKNKI